MGREGLPFCPKCDCVSSPVGRAGRPGGLTCVPFLQYAGINPLDDVNSEVSAPGARTWAFLPSPCISAPHPLASGTWEAFLLGVGTCPGIFLIGSVCLRWTFL